AYYHKTLMMAIPGGALIRHVEKSEDGDVAVAVLLRAQSGRQIGISARPIPAEGLSIPAASSAAATRSESLNVEINVGSIPATQMESANWSGPTRPPI